MKIAELHIYQHDLTVVGEPYRYAGTALTAMDTTLVKLVTDKGVIGWGEVCPLGPTYQAQHAAGARAALAEMAPNLIGAPLSPVTLHHIMDQRLAGHQYAKAAVDIAAHDAVARTLGIPVHDLLGGAHQLCVPSYYAVGIATPEDTARIAVEKADEGYPRLQLKIGGRNVEEDAAALRLTHEALGGRVRLAADANRSLTARDALILSNLTADIPYVLEQPCATMEEIAAIRPHIRQPIYLDEVTTDLSAVLHAVGANLCDGFGMKLTRIGGLHPMRTVRDICAARGLPHTCDDSWGGDIIAAACVHMAATVAPRLSEGAWLAAPYVDGHYDPNGGIFTRAGHIDVPSGPGLGITPDEALFGPPIASFG